MEEKIDNKLEKIKNNDTGLIVKIYANIIWIMACVFSAYMFFKQVTTIASLGNGVTIQQYIGLLLIYTFVIFSSLVVKDILLMFYEIHFIIKHRKD